MEKSRGWMVGAFLERVFAGALRCSRESHSLYHELAGRECRKWILSDTTEV